MKCIHFKWVKLFSSRKKGYERYMTHIIFCFQTVISWKKNEMFMRERERERGGGYILHAWRSCFLCSQGFVICWVHPGTVDCTEKNIKETRDWKDEWEKRHQRGQTWWVSSVLWRCVECCASFCHQFLKLRPMQHWMPLMVWLSFWIIYHNTVESTSAVTTWIPLIYRKRRRKKIAFYPHCD